MSTGFYTRISNTVVSGSNLLADLDFDANALRALEMKGALACCEPRTLAAGAVVANTLSANEWVDAVNYGLNLIPPGGVSSILLGSDMASVAKQYQNLFNITSTNQVRTLRFVLNANTASYTTISLANSSGGPQTYVQIKPSGGTADNTQALFSQANGANLINAGNAAGFVRDVVVSADSLTSGSETIIFDILGGSV
jgi:hypothetical protein